MSWCKWLGRDPSDSIEELITTLAWCHQAAASTNNNASSAALINAATCDAGFEASLASAILTAGGIHGPTAQARKLLYSTENDAIILRLEDGDILSGWGNAFHKKSIDPSFVPMEHLLKSGYHEHSERLDEVAEIIFKVKGNVLYPNPAAFTAVCAEILQLPVGVEMVLAIVSRLPTWTRQYVGARP